MTHEINWQSAITPAAIAQQQFTYQGRWIRNWFSNMLPFDEPLVFQGITYYAPENLYQAMKTLDPDDRTRIAGLSPAEAKKAGRRLVVHPDWEQVKERYMAAALRHKFKPGTSWHANLMATGNSPIVEFNNWHDNFWGACICERCQLRPKQNRLGVLLMSLRAEYKSAQPLGEGQEMTSTEQPLPPKPALNPLAAVKPNNPGVLPHLERDRIVAAAATQFIGYSARDERYASMTRKYQQAWAEIDRANTGVYSPKDLIMVSGSGQWGCVTVQQIQQTFNEQVVPLLNLAIAVRARFIVGNASGNDRLVRQHLEGKGYRAVVGIAGYLEFSPPPKEQESINQVREAAPAYIAELAPNQVFVFGSNTEGRHGKGAALTAFGSTHPKRKGAIGKWAIYGQARGLMRGHEGMSYGIVTKDLSRGKRSIPLAEIESQVGALLDFACQRPDLELLVTPFGTALAGYSDTDIAKLWQGKDIPKNVRLPQAWFDLIGL